MLFCQNKSCLSSLCIVEDNSNAGLNALLHEQLMMTNKNSMEKLETKLLMKMMKNGKILIEIVECNSLELKTVLIEAVHFLFISH